MHCHWIRKHAFAVGLSCGKEEEGNRASWIELDRNVISLRPAYCWELTGLIGLFACRGQWREKSLNILHVHEDTRVRKWKPLRLQWYPVNSKLRAIVLGPRSRLKSRESIIGPVFTKGIISIGFKTWVSGSRLCSALLAIGLVWINHYQLLRKPSFRESMIMFGVLGSEWPAAIAIQVEFLSFSQLLQMCVCMQ